LTDTKVSLAESAKGLQQLIHQASLPLEQARRLLRGNRPALTLLCSVNNQFVRAEVNDKGELLGEPQRLAVEYYTITDLPSAITTVLKSDQPLGRQLWLLHDALPNHTVELPSGQVAGLSDEQINQALLFELQELSGIVTTNLQSSHVLLAQVEAQNLYLLSHAPKTLMAQLRRVARECGCRFAGLMHPGGLPYGIIHDKQPNAWARLERWADVLIGVNGDGQGHCKLWAMQSGAKPKRVQSEVERWRLALGDKIHWESLGEGMAMDFLPEQTRAVSLDRDDTLGLWLSAWGRTLAGGKPAHLPALVPPDDPNRERWLMAAGASVALALCLLHFGWQYRREHSLESDKVFLKGSESQIRGLETEVGRYQKQRDEMAKKLEPGMRGRAAATPEVLAALRQRLTALLREIAVNSTDGVVIEEIRTKPEATIVKGISLNAAEANKLASALEARLRGLGWRIEPPRKKDLALDAGGGPWEFEILLSDAGSSGYPNAPKPQATTVAK
jgi:hypothetical protein